MDHAILGHDETQGIAWSKGCKYVLEAPVRIQTGIKPKLEIDVAYRQIKLYKKGFLVISPGYAWDGPSGPTFDPKCSMLPSLIHDVFYHLMRLGLVDISERGKVDILLRTLLVQEGMIKTRAKLWYWCVRKFAEKFARKKKKVYTFGKEKK